MGARSGGGASVGMGSLRDSLVAMQSAAADRLGLSGKVVIGTKVTGYKQDAWRQNATVNDFSSVKGSRYLYIDSKKGDGSLVQRFGSNTPKESKYAKMIAKGGNFWVFDTKKNKYL